MRNDGGGGGFAARRAVARWAIRLFRRDWRQQILIVVLLTFSVAFAVFGISAAFNVIPTSDGEYGTANHRLTLRADSVGALQGHTDELEAWFGTIEVVGRRYVQVPGDVARLELRAQDTDGPFSGPTLALLEGRYPASADEAAVTDGAAELLGVEIGSVADVGNGQLSIVGIVENPARLNDEFALVPATDLGMRSDTYTVLTSASAERAVSLPASVPVEMLDRRPQCHAVICLSASQSEQATGAAAALGIVTPLFLLVALVAAAGFVVVAQRRTRQLGMFMANGATDRHLKLVVLANGALVGTLSAIAGGILGVGAWIGAAPLLEEASGHRIDRLHLPWWLLGAALLLAIFTAIAASRKPARDAIRSSIVSALAGRPPSPKPLRRSAILAVTLIIAGIVALSQAVDIPGDSVNPLLLVTGIVSLTVGVIFLSPTILGALGHLASRVPIAPRIALRDLARYRARSSTALGAISLALAIPVIVIVAASAAQFGAGEGNLSDRQLIIRTGDDPALVPDRTPPQIDALQTTIDALVAQTEASATLLHVATDPNESLTRGADTLRPAVILGRPVGQDTIRDIDVLHVATPQLVDLLGLPPATTGSLAEILTPHTGDLTYANTAERAAAPPSTATIDAPPYSSIPTSLITQTALQQHGWTATPAGWLLQADKPITGDLRRTIRSQAADAGLTVEFRDQQAALGTLRTAATAAGVLAALSVLALTLGLVRSEGSDQLRTLTATGATSTFRRNLSGANASTLAATGVLLGTLVAYGGLAAGYADDLATLRPIPYINLGIMLIGTPLIAGLAGWLLAGREPATIKRTPIELGFPRNRGGLLVVDGVSRSPAPSCRRCGSRAGEAI